MPELLFYTPNYILEREKERKREREKEKEGSERMQPVIAHTCKSITEDMPEYSAGMEFSLIIAPPESKPSRVGCRHSSRFVCSLFLFQAPFESQLAIGWVLAFY